MGRVSGLEKLRPCYLGLKVVAKGYGLGLGLGLGVGLTIVIKNECILHIEARPCAFRR